MEAVNRIYRHLEISMSELSREDLQDMVMEPWLELRAEISMGIAA